MSDLNVPFSPGPPIAADTDVVIRDAGEQPRIRGRFLVAFGLGLIAALILGVAALYAYDRVFDGRVLPGVRVGSVDLSGLSPNEAQAALDSAYATLAEGELTLTTPAGERSIPFRTLERRIDSQALVAEAVAAGREGTPIDRAVGNVRTTVRGVTLEPRVVYDEEALTREVNRLAATVHRSPVDAAVTPTERGFESSNASDGQELVAELPASAVSALTALDAPARIEAEMQLAAIDPEVTSLEAQRARIAATRMARDVVLRVGEQSWTIKGAAIHDWISFTRAIDGTYTAVVDEAKIPDALRRIARRIARPAKDASFLVGRSGGVVGVTAARDGRRLNSRGTTNAILQALQARAAGSPSAPIRPVLQVIPPKLTTEQAERSAPLMRRISRHTTYFPIGIKNGFGANIWIPASLIDGYVVAPGATFDFWKAVGPVTREKGYRDGGAIINGRTEPTGALAGGICSCSTTLFNAALKAGFPMKARRNHYYYIDRYPLGLDATVFISAGGSVQTMSWRNDTRHPVLIRGINSRSGSAGYVTFELYSVPNDRRVVIGNPTVRNVRYATDTVQYTNSLPPGARERIEYPVNGMQVWRTVSVYEKGKLLHRTTYYSNYARITGITLVGRGSAAS